LFWVSKRDEFIKKARQAEARAAGAHDAGARAAWARIATSYLELAQRLPQSPGGGPDRIFPAPDPQSASPPDDSSPA
jgi:hypothetical protein